MMFMKLQNKWSERAPDIEANRAIAVALLASLVLTILLGSAYIASDTTPVDPVLNLLGWVGGMLCLALVFASALLSFGALADFWRGEKSAVVAAKIGVALLLSLGPLWTLCGISAMLLSGN